jgi:hypothetical protein
LPKREAYEDEHYPDEYRPIGFERRQLADPGAADTEGYQHQRRDAAKRTDDRSQRAGPHLLGCGLHEV